MSRSIVFTFSVLVMVCIALPCHAETATRDSVSLNGIWDFYPDGKDQKFDIRVPSFWDAPQEYGYPEEWLHMRHGVYKKSFTIPASMKDKEIFLKIKRISVIAKVFVNGKQVGAEDTNGYLMLQLPYLIDITSAAKVGDENHIEVQVWGGKSMIHGSDSQDNLMQEDDFPADAKDQGRLLYPWCVDHWDGRRGIDGDVLLLAYPKVYVSDVFVIPNLQKNTNPADDEITLRFTLVNKDTKTHTVSLTNTAALVEGNQEKLFETVNIILPANSEQLVMIPNVQWDNANYWWPENPQLYDLNTQLIEDGKPGDTVKTRFGFREFYVHGDHYELNGIRANLRGDAYEFSWHEGFRHGPSTAPVFSTKELIVDMQKKIVREYQALNNNMLRPHKASGIDELYDACDENGMMVFDEAPFWQTWIRTDERAKKNFEAWVKRMVNERKNHPSIVAWVGANECWEGPIPMYSIQAIRSVDSSRPVFQDDPRGNYGGDEDCRHYTGGYPIKALNTEDLYNVYKANPDKPTGEGESLFADGLPLLNPDGTLSGKNSQRGEFGNPDMISQAQWIRSVCRLVRAMRYAGFSDSRLYASWMYCFDPIEADFQPEWNDLSAPGIKPILIHRPICNIFSKNYPEFIYNSGREYYKNSFSPVAVFDKEFDQQNRIGVKPSVFKPGENLARELIVYNDEFQGGTEITVDWQTINSITESQQDVLQTGSYVIHVPYGEKRMQELKITLPKGIEKSGWLNFTLYARKGNILKYTETNRLGALNQIPAPKLSATPLSKNLGEISQTATPQWHKICLINQGGGLSEKWSVSGLDSSLKMNLESGNLRAEQEIYFQVNANALQPGEYVKKLQFQGESGSTTATEIRFTVTR